MDSSEGSPADRSWVRNAARALLVTVVSGVIVAWLIRDARFSPGQRNTPTPSPDQLSTTSEPVLPTFVRPSPTPTTIPVELLSTPIGPEMSYNGTIAAGELDTYSFLSSDAAVMNITVSPVGPFLFRVEIQYYQGGKIAEAENYRGQISGVYSTSLLEFAPEPDVEYVICVRGQNENQYGSYIIRMAAAN